MSITYSYFKGNMGHDKNQWYLIILSSCSKITVTDIRGIRDGTSGVTLHRGRGKFSTSPTKGSMLSYALIWLCCCILKQWVWVKLALWHCVNIRQPSPISAASSQTAAQRAVLSLQYLHKRIIAGVSIKTYIQEAWSMSSPLQLCIFPWAFDVMFINHIHVLLPDTRLKSDAWGQSSRIEHTKAAQGQAKNTSVFLGSLKLK